MVHKHTLFNCHTGLLPYVLDIGKMNPEKQVELYQSLIHTGPRFGYRHVFSLLGFLGFLNVYAMRVNLSVAIVAMVNSTSPGIANNTNITDGTCPAPITPGNTTSDTTGDFDWDEKTQSLVLGCWYIRFTGKSMRVARGALGAVYHMTSLTSATQWASKPKPNLAINYTNMRRHNLCRMLIPAPAHNKLVGGHQKPSDH